MHLEDLEAQLDDFSLERRKAAFLQLCEEHRKGNISFPTPRPVVNLHFHTFFSFNACGYSPLHIVWLSRLRGLSVAGSVDFDVLDAMEEFQFGGFLLGLPVVSGLETRIYLPEFREEELSSPNEPGIAYYMGSGFVRFPETEEGVQTLRKLKTIAQERNKKIIARVNAYLEDVVVDYERDVLPLTPSGNPTERHIVVAYAQKSREVFPDALVRARFWAEKLGVEVALVQALEEDLASLYDTIRSRLMKFGGVGYVKPDVGDFPRIQEVNSMIASAGAIPSFSWLDGTRSGEADPRRLVDFCEANGVETFFLVPDRNWNIPDDEERKYKVRKLYEFVETAQQHHFPVFVGTELNRYGQKFVDDFDSPYLAPLAPFFLESAWILWGHAVLEMSSRRGYGSEWAKRTFRSREKKNRFFARVGMATPADYRMVQKLGERTTEALLKEFSE
ncbi:MAG: hypothetical protein N2205_04830 [Candidatus Caldatribacterium sp.]|uniref:hypothetical protein n=1 Tax=Candidatus Caldatribacterium sp. TaxID=2282143 RepID=UPI0029928C37|nr:hypothetical protein [Candidatus Caldatribacterium sp.]MCX7730523.1 hypothetical protein [Candidatus Caldatribacterium sp.]MDW8081835.1 hypothetical protein [Candidatus Calescibacterium sp.]